MGLETFEFSDVSNPFWQNLVAEALPDEAVFQPLHDPVALTATGRCYCSHPPKASGFRTCSSPPPQAHGPAEPSSIACDPALPVDEDVLARPRIELAGDCCQCMP